MSRRIVRTAAGSVQWNRADDRTMVDERTAAILEVGELFWLEVRAGDSRQTTPEMIAAIARLSLADPDAARFATTHRPRTTHDPRD